MSNVEKDFWVLCDKACNAWNNSADTKTYEPALVEILEFIKYNKESQLEIESFFIDIVSGKRKIIFEIVIFCMRELRWNNVLEQIEAEIQSSSNYRDTQVLEKMREVYDLNWEDEDLWNYYSKK